MARALATGGMLLWPRLGLSRARRARGKLWGVSPEQRMPRASPESQRRGHGEDRHHYLRPLWRLRRGKMLSGLARTAGRIRPLRCQHPGGGRGFCFLWRLSRGQRGICARGVPEKRGNGRAPGHGAGCRLSAVPADTAFQDLHRNALRPSRGCRHSPHPHELHAQPSEASLLDRGRDGCLRRPPAPGIPRDHGRLRLTPEGAARG